jgi:putative transposase
VIKSADEFGDKTTTINQLWQTDFTYLKVIYKPRLLSDNGSSYVSDELAEWLDDKKMGHVRGAPYHSQTQGKIELWHQTLKNRSVGGLLLASRPGSAD